MLQQQHIITVQNPDHISNLPDSVQNPDHISNLPDSILHCILSFLHATDAVKTVLLSKRWAHLFTSTPNLHFQKSRLCKRNDNDFVSFVNQALILYESPTIQEFHLVFYYKGKFYNPIIDDWIRFALWKKARVLHLDLSGDSFSNWGYWKFVGIDPYSLPLDSFNNDSLTELRLNSVNINPPMIVSWKNMKRLSLEQTSMADYEMERILNGCPVLEELFLYKCNGISRLDFRGRNVRKLTVNDYDSEFGLEIWGPNVMSLNISGDIGTARHRFKSLPSLVNATLNLQMSFYAGWDDYEESEYHDIFRALLDALRHARVLKVCTWCVQVLSIWELIRFPAPIFSCNYLILETGLRKWDLPGIVGLLRSSPYLETLIIKIIPTFYLNWDETFEYFMAKYYFHGVEYLASQESNLPCLEHCLKTIKIFGFIGGGDKYKKQKAWSVNRILRRSMRQGMLVKFLLKNAMVLDKMTIYASNEREFKMIKKWSGVFSEVSKDILAFPRASSHAEVSFSYA
ncbi:F-box protein At5g03100-like [Magnolia sinica]|uniref:F-box protein At5g03100-like n=1 Tax=Magnolia sinica TaxID=86752 RepID=UPI00265B2370|nr:F-box protein At5g03100-like [Magnolia sinica]